MRTSYALAFAAALLVGAAALFALREPRAPHVIVYLIDTLRVDHVGTYGYARDTTPIIDALAAESVLFENAYAPASWTRPSVGTLFTGVLPSRHGAKRADDALRPDLATLAGVLRSHGYASHGFTCNPAVDPVFGFARDFDSYTRYGEMDDDARISDVHDPVEAFLDEREASGDEQPLFLFVHVCAPHHPYAPPPPYDTRFVPSDDGRTEQRLARYDGEIAYSDAELGKLLERLRAGGLLDESVFLLTSDHGEEFGEHGGWLHGHTLFEESLRVPLVLRLPGGAEGGRRVQARASLADVLPTLLSLLGLPPLDGLDGVDLSAAWRGEPVARRRPMFFELDLRRDRLDALIAGDHKLIDRESPASESGATLYQLAGPAPDRPVDDPARADALRALLDDARATLRAGFYVELANPRGFEGTHRVVGGLEVVGGAIEGFDAPHSEIQHFTVSEDRTRVDFTLALRNEPNVVSVRPALGGRVRMRLQLAGEEPRVRLAYAVDDEPAARVRLLEGATFRPREVALPYETAVARAELDLLAGGNDNGGRRPDLAALLAPPPSGSPIDAHVYRVPDRSAPALDLTPEMRARLRELGYLE